MRTVSAVPTRTRNKQKKKKRPDERNTLPSQRPARQLRRDVAHFDRPLSLPGATGRSHYSGPSGFLASLNCAIPTRRTYRRFRHIFLFYHFPYCRFTFFYAYVDLPFPRHVAWSFYHIALPPFSPPVHFTVFDSTLPRCDICPQYRLFANLSIYHTPQCQFAISI